MWRCRTIAFIVDIEEVVRFSCIINMRGKLVFKLPPGYYGNAFMHPTSITKAEMFCKNPLEYVVRLLKKIKVERSEEYYMKSLEDLMIIKGRPSFTKVGNYVVSDAQCAGFGEVASDGGRQFMVGLLGQYQLKASACGLGTKKEKELLYLYAYLFQSWKGLNVR